MFFNQETSHVFERSDGQDIILAPPNNTTSLMYHQLSSGMLDHDGFEDLLLAPHLLQPVTGTTSLIPIPPPPPPPSSKKVYRRRGTRKDRHSKIVTAQGTRDRRMRLSLDVAKKFFDLQDLLGFDKASKTVEWLLTKSSKAIKAIKTTCSRSDHNLHQYTTTTSCCSKSSTTDFEVNSTTVSFVHQAPKQSGTSGTKSIHLEHNDHNQLSMAPGSSSWVPDVIICEEEQEEEESGGNKSLPDIKSSTELPAIEIEGEDHEIIQMVNNIANEEISTPIFNQNNNNMDGNDNAFFSFFPDSWSMYYLMGNDNDGN